jgi:hypothetical protein
LQQLSEAQRPPPCPAYDRASLKAGIMHFGVGNFHRAHQAIYLDDLFNEGQRSRLGDCRRGHAAFRCRHARQKLQRRIS